MALCPPAASRGGIHAAAVRHRSSTGSFFPDCLRGSHSGRRSTRSLFCGNSRDPLRDCRSSGAASLARNNSIRRSKSPNKPSIELATSVAITGSKSLNAWPSGTIAAAISVAPRIPAIAGANARYSSLTRFLIPSISLTVRSRSRRSLSAERRASNSAICAVSVVTSEASASRLLRARARSRLRLSIKSLFPNTCLLRICSTEPT